MKKIAALAGLFICYALAFSPLLLRYYEIALPLLNHEMIKTIFDNVIALAVVSIFFSLMAAVLRWYIVAYVFAFIPLFVEAVFLCSTALVFLFHKELAAAALFGKIRALGSNITQVATMPIKVVGSLYCGLIGS